VTKAASGRVEVIGGVNSPDAEEMVSLARFMTEQGVDGIMAMAVPSMADKGYGFWFQSIAEVTGGLPIILQNLFAPRGANLSAAEMLDLAHKVDAIRYVKEEAIPSGPKVSAVVRGMGDSLDGVIGGGGARYLFEELERGVVATMPAIELLELHVALMDAYAAGRRAEALGLYERSVPLLLMQAPYRMRLTKLILQHRGIIRTDSVREELPELDDVSRALILEMYRALEQESEAAVA
jgi:4-hydroxy-tetrahydrodipicolinate synthase